jgi:peptidyl-prolyl cis-trans isomerase D
MADKKINPIKKIVTIALFVLLIASFGAWGIGDILTTSSGSFPVAQVGKSEISQQEFTRALRQELNRLAPQFGGRLDIEQARSFGIVQQVLDRMVDRALFEQHTNDLGLVVTKDQIRDRIAKLPAFQDQFGKFDRIRFEQALRNSGLTEAAFVAGLTGDIQRDQLTNAIAGGMTTPRTLADVLYRYSAETRVAETVLFGHDSAGVLPEPTEQQIQHFYDTDSGSFMAPEYRKLAVLQIRPSELTDEVAVSDQQLREEYDLRLDELSIAERRAVSQILYPSREEADEALAKIEEGRDFAAVADETGAGSPVSLGLVSQTDLSLQLPELAASAFALEKDGVSDPVQSPLGWHLIKVSEIQPGFVPPFEDVSEQLNKDIKLRLATDTAISLANSLDDSLAGGAGLEDAAASLGLEVETFERVDRNGQDAEGAVIDALPGSRNFLTIAFATEAGKESLLTEAQDGSYFLVRVVEVIPTARKPLDQVRDSVIAAWKDGERDRVLRETAMTFVENVNSGSDFAELAQKAGLTVSRTPAMRRFNTTPTDGVPLDLPAKLFDLEQGKADSVDASDGIMVARLVETTAAPEETADAAIESLQTNLDARLQNDLIEQFVTTLNDEYRVVIRAENLNTALSQF